MNFPKTRGVKLGNYSISRGPWYYSSSDGPIISGKTFLCYKAYGTYVEEYTIPYGIETVSCNAFTDLYSLKNIEIPDTVKYIGSYAFAYTDISEIVIPDGVEAINDGVFQGCEYLEKVTFPDKITYIGNGAFEYCEKLSGKFEIPEDVTYIGYNAFYGTSYSDFKFSENNKVKYVGDGAFDYTDWYDAQAEGPYYIDNVFLGIKSTNDNFVLESVVIKDGTIIFAGNALMYCDANINVPDSVKYINDYAFSYSNATNDDIPENLVEIGNNAFAYCSNITEFNMPESLKSIGEYAFDGCSNLTTVTESDDLISIGDYAFRTTKINTFPVGSALEKIGVGVFQDSKNLEKFTVKSNNKNFSEKSGVLYNKEQSIIICYPPLKKDTTLVIEEDILSFKGAFDNGNEYITEIIVEEGVRSIPERAFEYLINVKEITIPTTVRSIGCYLFSYNSALETVNYNAIDCNSYNAFQDCDKLTTVNIGEEVTSISPYMFELCRNLEYVNFGGNVEFIGQEAFYCTKWDENIRNCADGEMVYVDKVLYCSNNVSGDVTIKNGTKSIYYDVFNNYTYSSNVTSVSIPDSVVFIGDGAFSHCYNLKTVKMSSNIEHIGNYAFNSCSNMNSVDLGNKLTFLGEGAFNYCSSIKSLTIPSGVKEIFRDTFSGCSQLTDVTLNEGLEHICEYAFYSNKSLQSIKIPSTVEEISYEAFGESGLKKVELNEGLESISDYVFTYCEQLESINFPSTLKTIGYQAFYRCISLKKLELNEGLERMGNYAFNTCSSIESVVIPSTLESIGSEAFSYCTSLKNLTIREGVNSIGDYSFYACSALESVVLPSTIEMIDYSAFSYCSALKNVTLNEGLTYIGSSAFYGTAIESIVIPSTLTEIYYGIFTNCANLKSVTLKEGLVDICDGSFQGCTSLKEILIPSTVTNIGSNVFNNNMIIHGYTNSYAQAYVDYHYYNSNLTHTFVEIERMMGDVNGDGTVNVTDVTELQKYLAGMTTLTQKQLASSNVTDVEYYNKIDIKDASYIAKALAGFCEL